MPESLDESDERDEMFELGDGLLRSDGARHTART